MTVSKQLRRDVWEGRFFTYRLSQYYGKLAHKQARLAQLQMTAGCVLAIASPYLQMVIRSLEWVPTLTGLLGAVVAVHTLAKGQQKSATSMMRSLQLKHLKNEWDVLWERVDAHDAEVKHIRSRWKELSSRLEDITGPAIAETVDEGLLDRVFTESAKYIAQSEDINVATT